MKKRCQRRPQKSCFLIQNGDMSFQVDLTFDFWRFGSMQKNHDFWTPSRWTNKSNKSGRGAPKGRKSASGYSTAPCGPQNWQTFALVIYFWYKLVMEIALCWQTSPPRSKLTNVPPSNLGGYKLLIDWYIQRQIILNCMQTDFLNSLLLRAREWFWGQVAFLPFGLLTFLGCRR